MARAGAAAFLVFFSAFAAAAFFAAFAAAAVAMVRNGEGQKDRNEAMSTDPQQNQGMPEPNCCRTGDINLRTVPNNVVPALLR